MASTYVNDLRLNEMATGDGSGTWGTTTNTNLELIGEALGYGTEAITTNADTHTSTIADGATDPVRSMYVKYTGTLDSACTITIAPNTVCRMQFIENATSGSQNIVISQGSGANITIPAGDVKAVYLDGAGSGAAVVDAFASLNVVDLKVQDDLTVTDDLTVNGDIDLAGSIDVDGTANLDVVDIDGAVQIDSTVTVGADDTGYDVKFFGDTASAYMLWDTSADDLVLAGAAGIDLAGDIDVDGTANLDVVDIDGAVDMASTLTLAGNADFNGDLDVDGTTNLDAVDIDGATQIDATVTVGVDDTGYDVKFFGATSGAYMLWDESADDLKLVGAAGLTVAGDIDVDGTTNLDAVDVDGAVNFAADVTYADGADIITASAGTSNFRAGVNAGNSIASGGNYNVVVGDEAGTAITTGDNNVAVGYAALDALTTASNNTAVGTDALTANTSGDRGAALGKGALAANTTGTENVGIGYLAMDANTTGAANTAVGSEALGANTTANYNVAVGTAALILNTTGASNVAVGALALDTNSSSSHNTAIGYAALTTNSGADNTAVGSLAMEDCSSGHSNVAIGVSALGNLTTGNTNIVIGEDAGDAMTTASGNVIIGHSAAVHDVNFTTGSDCIIIGAYSDTSSGDASQQVVIGQNLTSKGNTTTFVTGVPYNGNNQAAWETTSDERIKKNISDNSTGLSEINQIRVRNFEYRTPEEVTELPSHAAVDSQGIQVGVIAQEIETILPDMVNVESTGVKAVSTNNLTWYLVNAVQELSAKVEELESQPKCKCKGE